MTIHADAPQHGWLGLELKELNIPTHELGDLGRNVVCVDSVPFGPAMRAGIKTYDFVLSINSLSWREYWATTPQIGSTAIVKIYRAGQSGPMLFELKLVKRPIKRCLVVTTLPLAKCGPDVFHTDRNKWFSVLLSATTITDLALRIAGLLAFKYRNSETGMAFPSHRRLARDCSKSVSSVQRALRLLHRNGVLKIRSGGEGRSNSYTICHPQGAGACPR